MWSGTMQITRLWSSSRGDRPVFQATSRQWTSTTSGAPSACAGGVTSNDKWPFAPTSLLSTACASPRSTFRPDCTRSA
eukprot:11197060-Lingulodinium_polyedra.AAC.1